MQTSLNGYFVWGGVTGEECWFGFLGFSMYLLLTPYMYAYEAAGRITAGGAFSRFFATFLTLYNAVLILLVSTL